MAAAKGGERREAGRHEREIFRFWADAAQHVGGEAAAQRVHALGLRRGAWPRVRC